MTNLGPFNDQLQQAPIDYLELPILSETDSTITPIPAIVVASDGFGRADASSLGVADVGGAWSDPSNAFGISTGRAYMAALGLDRIAYLLTGQTECTVKGTFRTPVSGDFRAGLSFWIVDAANYWRSEIDTAAGSVSVVQVVAGVQTTIAQVFTLPALAPSSDHVMQLVLSGGAVTVQLDTFNMVGGTGLPTGTRHGLWLSSDSDHPSTPSTPLVAWDLFEVATLASSHESTSLTVYPFVVPGDRHWQLYRFTAMVKAPTITG